MRARDPVAVLLLPRRVEEFALRAAAEELLRAPGVVAVEPGRLPVSLFGRVPERRATRLARGQARRLATGLPGRAVAIVLFHPMQWPLARELAARSPRAEVWYGGWDAAEDPHHPDADPALLARLAALDREAAGAAALAFAQGADRVEPRLWERLVALGIDTGPAGP